MLIKCIVQSLCQYIFACLNDKKVNLSSGDRAAADFKTLFLKFISSINAYICYEPARLDQFWLVPREPELKIQKQIFHF